MEKINRHNYEAYFLDYLEGNLAAEEKHDLLVFLEQNPDLKKELDIDLSQLSLTPSDTVFENKPALKVSDDSLLTLNSVEAWMIESVEGNLSASKQQELDDFVRRHQLEKTYTAYQSTVLKADLTEVFDEKKKLKVATGIVIPMYARVAAVAAVAVLLIGIALNRPDGTETVTAENGSGNGVMLASKTDAGEWARRMMHATDSVNNEFNITPGQQNFYPKQDKKREKPDQSIIPLNLVNHEDDSNNKDSLKEKGNELPYDVVDKNKNNQEEQQQVDDQDDVAIQNSVQKNNTVIVTEEPYKIVTDAASTVTKRDVHFTRDRNTTTNEYVAYGFKIGGFEFERKK